MKLTEVACSIAATEEGVEHVFGLMGDGNMSLITYLSGPLGVSFHSARHESGAIGMADGYARASGTVGVCTVTQGPGLTNAITALVTARKARSPLILLVGDLGKTAPDHPQHLDQSALLKVAGVPVIRATNARTIHDDIRAAFRSARERCAPIAVDFPLEHQRREWEPWDVDVDRPTERPRDAQLADGSAVRRAADALTRARRPVIIGGRGAVAAQSGAALRRLAERVGALLATTLPAKGLFAEDPYDVGIAESLGTSLAWSLISQADVVLAVGAGLNDYTTAKGTLFRDDATVIRCDLVAGRARDGRDPMHFLHGDAAAVAGQLLVATSETGSPREGYRTPDVTERLRGFDPRSEFADMAGADGMDPRSLVLALNDVVPRERQVVVDAGHFFGFPSTYMSVSGAGRFFPTLDFGAVGSGLGVALGASIARPDLTTVLFVGDGGLLMSLPDLDTLSREQPGMIVVVVNDRAYGAEVHMLRRSGLPTDAAELGDTPFEEIAKAFGLRSRTMRDVATVASLGDELSRGIGPLLLDCRVTRRVVAPWLEDAMYGHGRAEPAVTSR